MLKPKSFLKAVISFVITTIVVYISIHNTSAGGFSLSSFKIFSKEITVVPINDMSDDVQAIFTKEILNIAAAEIKKRNKDSYQPVLLLNEITQTTCTNIKEFTFAERMGWFAVAPLCNTKLENTVAFLKTKEMRNARFPRLDTVRFTLLFIAILDIYRTTMKTPTFTKRSITTLYRTILDRLIADQLKTVDKSKSLNLPPKAHSIQPTHDNIVTLIEKCSTIMSYMHSVVRRMAKRVRQGTYTLPSSKKQYESLYTEFFKVAMTLANTTHLFARAATLEYIQRKTMNTHGQYRKQWVAKATTNIITDSLIRYALTKEEAPVPRSVDDVEKTFAKEGTNIRSPLKRGIGSAHEKSVSAIAIALYVILGALVLGIILYLAYRIWLKPWLNKRAEDRTKYQEQFKIIQKLLGNVEEKRKTHEDFFEYQELSLHQQYHGDVNSKPPLYELEELSVKLRDLLGTVNKRIDDHEEEQRTQEQEQNKKIGAKTKEENEHTRKQNEQKKTESDFWKLVEDMKQQLQSLHANQRGTLPQKLEKLLTELLLENGDKKNENVQKIEEFSKTALLPDTSVTTLKNTPPVPRAPRALRKLQKFAQTIPK